MESSRYFMLCKVVIAFSAQTILMATALCAFFVIYRDGHMDENWKYCKGKCKPLQWKCSESAVEWLHSVLDCSDPLHGIFHCTQLQVITAIFTIYFSTVIFATEFSKRG